MMEEDKGAAEIRGSIQTSRKKGSGVWEKKEKQQWKGRRQRKPHVG